MYISRQSLRPLKGYVDNLGSPVWGNHHGRSGRVSQELVAARTWMEAKRFLKKVGERLAKFGLGLHPGKIRLIELRVMFWDLPLLRIPASCEFLCL
jgi:hypothetical protein